MLIRIIILAAVIALAVSMYRRWQAANNPDAPKSNSTAAMKKCAHCGIHLPEQDALKSGEHYFCSEQHRLAFDQQHSDHD